MGSGARAVTVMALVLLVPLACGPSSSGDDDDGGESGAAGESANGGRAGGSAGTSSPSSGATGGTGSGAGGTSVGGRGGSDMLPLPGGGRSLFGGAGPGGSASGAAGSTENGGTSAAGRGGTTTGGLGGTGGKGGTGGGAGKPAVSGTFGKSCSKDSDCDEPTLTCLGSDDLSDGSGPAGGLCTKTCTTVSDCTTLGDAYCYTFGSGEQYCIEACTTGTAGSPKCHSRADVACSLVGLIPTQGSCAVSTDCGSNELCDTSTERCGTVVTGCLPQCAGDFQCADGEHCDFTTGLCVGDAPTGLPLGSVCTPPTGNATDPCQGFCDAGADPGQGICEALCVLDPSLVGCGWDGTGTPDQVCLFGTVLSPPGDVAMGDVAICGAMCDCNADCKRTGDYCVDETGGDVKTIWNRNGYCRPLDTGESTADTFESCDITGAGGAGG